MLHGTPAAGSGAGSSGSGVVYEGGRAAPGLWEVAVRWVGLSSQVTDRMRGDGLMLYQVAYQEQFLLPESGQAAAQAVWWWWGHRPWGCPRTAGL